MSIFEMARELALVRTSASVLGWDQETFLPAGAAKHRAAQLAWLATKAHEMSTSEDWRRALETAEAEESDERQRANLRELRRQFERETKLPVDLVARSSET